jgi:hypothetical protein
MNEAGTLTGTFYSYGDVPTKGCFIKGENMYFGSGGTVTEMNDSDLDGVQERVWCDATSSTEERSDNGGHCLTEDKCKEKFTIMKENKVIDGYFYASSDFPTKGCLMKGENVFFGVGGTDDEMTASDLPGEQLRLVCDGTSNRPQTSSIASGEDQLKAGGESGGESKGLWSLNTMIGVAVGGTAALVMLIIGLKRWKRKGEVS